MTPRQTVEAPAYEAVLKRPSLRGLLGLSLIAAFVTTIIAVESLRRHASLVQAAYIFVALLSIRWFFIWLCYWRDGYRLALYADRVVLRCNGRLIEYRLSEIRMSRPSPRVSSLFDQSGGSYTVRARGRYLILPRFGGMPEFMDRLKEAVDAARLPQPPATLPGEPAEVQ